jgi:hypothetical protein
MKPDMIVLSSGFVRALRAFNRTLGPRHRAADRWQHELGWNIEPGALAKWLGAER